MNRVPPGIWLILLVVSFGLGRACDDIDLHNIVPIVTPDDPAPITESGLYVMIVREATGDSGMTPAQLSAIDSGVFADYLTAKSAKWRKFDRDNPPDLESQVWRDAWQKHFASRPADEFPAILVSNGKTGIVTKLPADLDGLMAVVKKYGDAL